MPWQSQTPWAWPSADSLLLVALGNVAFCNIPAEYTTLSIWTPNTHWKELPLEKSNREGSSHLTQGHLGPSYSTVTNREELVAPGPDINKAGLSFLHQAEGRWPHVRKLSSMCFVEHGTLICCAVLRGEGYLAWSYIAGGLLMSHPPSRRLPITQTCWVLPIQTDLLSVHLNTKQNINNSKALLWSFLGLLSSLCLFCLILFALPDSSG